MICHGLSSIMVATCLILSGFVAHHGIWKHGDWDENIWKVLCLAMLIHGCLAVSLACLPFIGSPMTTLQVHDHLLVIQALHFIGVFASTGIYRAFFHPLHHFPGPFAARLSVWSRLYTVWATEHKHAVALEKMHEKYGDVVRYGEYR